MTLAAVLTFPTPFAPALHAYMSKVMSYKKIYTLKYKKT